MADSIKIGNLDISAFKVGSGDCTVYLGNTLLYPTTFQGKWKATYGDSSTASAACDVSSAITSGEITLSDLVSVEIGDCVNTIEMEAFWDAETLSSCTIGNNVTTIGGDAFHNCYNLSEVNIPSGATSIGYGAFCGCRSITSIDIPNGVTAIEGEVFYDCRSLTSITIPNTVTTIGNSAFYNCYSLTSITIPSGVTSIGEEAFDSCSGLTSITVNATTPATLGSSAFDNTNNCPIYVPASAVETYKSGWSNYASRIQAIPNS